jgi:exodeoxyribonuclease V alpha subunit
MPVKIHLEEFERMLARKIQPEQGYFSQFICRAYSQGHTAVRYENRQLYPDASTVFTADGREYLAPQEIQQIEEQIRSEIEQQLFSNCIQEGPFIALPSAYAVEKGIANEIVRLNAASSPCTSVFSDPRLNHRQVAAIKGACEAPVSTITGGPGTGKTFTAGLLLSQLAQVSQKKLHVALLAPTGRAVKNLYASIMRSFTRMNNAIVDAKTIHRALSEKCAYLPYNIVIVDEASMIEAEMMFRLLRRLYHGTRLVFLGDTNQLPSIDPGKPFFDMIEAKTTLVPNFRLTDCVRTENLDLRALATEVIAGNCEGVFEIFQKPVKEIAFIDLEECRQEDVLNVLKREVFEPWRLVKTLEEAQRLVGATALLCAVRKGPLGSEAMNRLAEELSPARFRPVVSTKNNYQLNVMNSDLGTLDVSSELIYFPEATIPSVLCCGIENAYAMTVHKSQGSEFDTVLFVLAPGMVCDTKLLYTAITRAKRRVIVISSRKAISKALLQMNVRESLLAHILRALINAPTS